MMGGRQIKQRAGNLPNALRRLSYCVSRRSRISCWRVGSLSMEREISRTSQGSGLRRYTVPSLPTSTIMKPRGRYFVRSAVLSVGLASDNTITSRSASSSGKASSISICCTNRGSAGLSAKTTTNRLTHWNSLISTPSASKNMLGVGVSTSWIGDWSCAIAGPINIGKTRAKQNRFKLPMVPNIGHGCANSMGADAIERNIFATPRLTGCNKTSETAACLAIKRTSR